MANVRRISKGEWLECALEQLYENGLEALRVERLARTLGIAKSGFYWHFRDREDFVTQLLEYWTHEYTEVVKANPSVRGGAPLERLLAMTDMIIRYDLARYDVALRAWAEHDELVARIVARVDGIRFKVLKGIFTELGFKGDELEMRTRLYVCYHSIELTMFRSTSQSRLLRLARKRVALLASPIPTAD